MSRSVLVHGPQGCGKTRNKDALAKHFGCKKILDGWTLGEKLPARRTLVLTQLVGDEQEAEARAKVRVIAFDDAMRMAGLQVLS